VPLLEPPIVEFAWRLPIRLKTRNGSGKWLLRQILYRHVPRHLVDRPKMGLSVFIDEWLRGPLRDRADDLLDPARVEREGILRAAPIRAAWDTFHAGRPHTALPLWTAIVFQAW
jgi:asparagine synthase (glutamine-hydrolysing)